MHIFSLTTAQSTRAEKVVNIFYPMHGKLKVARQPTGNMLEGKIDKYVYSSSNFTFTYKLWIVAAEKEGSENIHMDCLLL